MGDTITITAGSTKTGAFRGARGVYPATLVTHTIEGPFRSKQPGKEGEEFRLHEWGFSIEGAPDDASMVWITSGEATGSKSKTFGIISAVLGGREPPAGTTLDIERHLFGRMALVDVRENERGYLDAVAVTPMPTAPAPVAARRASPAAAAVADPDDGLPF